MKMRAQQVIHQLRRGRVCAVVRAHIHSAESHAAFPEAGIQQR